MAHKKEADYDDLVELEKVQVDGMHRLSEAFETSARRWELIVYPSLFAFVILAAYGFYLIYSLARDVHFLAISVDSNMTVMSSNMQSMADNVNHMNANIRSMSSNMAEINQKVGTLEPMLTNIDSMDRSMQAMTLSTNYMSNDMNRLNRNIGRPMSVMNTFMPW